MRFLSPKDAGAIMKRARNLLAADALSRSAFVVLDCLMFGCRRPGQPSVRASLSTLERLTGSARHTVLDALQALYSAGLLAKRKHRLLIEWRGGIASRQDVNEYEIIPPDTECSGCTVSTGKEGSKPASNTLWPRLPPCLPIRTVAEQLRLLGVA